MSMQGYSGAGYDRWVERQDTSTLHKMKETFWTTKQAVIKKLGKKEDEHVVASDSELDSKLEVFKAIQISSMQLLRAIEKYQDRLCTLSMEENGCGRFLKGHSGQDKTRAGKMMAAVGKSQSFSAQQRLALRVPLVRLYQEVETFRYRAISDTLVTINRMEVARTEYRGALLWMKDVSEQLDPDTYKQLEKFRKVQAQVKKTKAKFDKLKLDVMQKVDLLAASRCNMFSHVLANYQSSLLHFWEKTSRTMTAVAESFKGYQYYEFNIIKELQEPNKRLAEDSNRQPAEKELDDDFDPENYEYNPEESSNASETDLIGDLIGDFSDDNQEINEEINEEIRDSFEYNHEESTNSAKTDNQEISEEAKDRLISLGEEDTELGQQAEENSSLQNLYTGESSEKEQTEEKSREDRTKPKESTDKSQPFLDFGEDVLKLDEGSDFSGKIPKIEKKAPPKNVPKDLLSEEIEPDDSEKDDMTILNEILNAPSASGEDDFSREWQAVFGHTPLGAGGMTLTPGETDQSQKSAEFMPSNLLDVDLQMANLNIDEGAVGGVGAVGGAPAPQGPTPGSTSGQPKPSQQKPKSKKGQKSDMSAWFSLFADLDPLADPDAIGKQMEDMTDA